MIANYSRVQLLTDKYRSEGASKNNVGSVIEVYDNGDYEVEFSDENGIDFAQIVAREEELQIIPAESQNTSPYIAVVETKEVPSSVSSQRKRVSTLK